MESGKWWWRGTVILLLVGNLGVGVALSTQADRPPTVSQIKNRLFQPWQKPPVTFSHQLHEVKGIACTACHHDYQGGRNRWEQGWPVKKCEACHLLQPQVKRLDLKNAYHRQCKACHLKRRQQGQIGGPVKCLDCHR